MVTIDQVAQRDYAGAATPRTDAAARAKLPLMVWIYLIAVMTPLLFSVGTLLMTPLRAVLLVMVPILVVRLFSGGLGRVIPTDILFLLHLFWGAIALALNNPDQVVQQIGSVGMEFIGGYLLGRAYIRTRADFIALCRALSLLIAVLLPFALYETMTGNPIIILALDKLPGVRGYWNVTVEQRLGLERVQGVFTHPIHFGLFCSSAFALTLVALKDILPDWRRLATGAAVGICVFVSLSSGAMLPMVMQSFFIIWAASFRKIGYERPWTVLIVLTSVCYVVIDILSNRTPLDVFFTYATFSPHTAYWRGIIFEWGMKNVWDNPLFGIGLNDWERPWFMYSGSMDNFWLVMGVRYGIPGFVLLAAGYGLMMWAVARRRLAADPILSQLRQAWMFTMIGLTFTLCTVHIWTSIYSFVFFIFGAGVWFIRAELSETGADGQGADGGTAGGGRRVGAPRFTRTPPEAEAVSGPGAGPAVGIGAGSASDAGSGPRYTRFPVRTGTPVR